MSPGTSPGAAPWLAALISVVHVAFLAFMVAAPFGSSRVGLALHFVLTPFLWLHWLMNDDTCFLTLLEKRVRGVDDDGSFVHALVGPVYKIEDADLRAWSWVASFALWMVTAARIRKADFVDLLTC